MASTGLEGDIQELTDSWERITDVPPRPHSMMRIIEYSLESQRKAEVYVNRFLRYFLDPEEPHGMNDEFLRAFLNSLPEECSFQEDIHDLSRVYVDEQVPIYQGSPEDESTDSPGYLDVLIGAPNEWFVMIELKFYAGENNLHGKGPSQTEAYYDATHFDGRQTDVFESGGYYVYVHPWDTAQARCSAFGNLTWRGLTEDLLVPFLHENAPRFPNRTVVQLRELIDDIQELTGMSEHDVNNREKVELYLNHYEAIQDVTEAFEDRWERFTEEWSHRLDDALDARDMSLEGWHTVTIQNDWGHLFRDGWWRREETREPIAERVEASELRVMFVHRLGFHRDEALRDNTLVFYFRNAGANDRAFIEEFNRIFYDREEEIDELLPTAAAITGQKRNLIEARYDIQPDEHDDFFDAYIAALERALIEHALENEPLVRTVTEIYDEALESYH